MPVMFLTEEQRHSYGTFTAVPDHAQLAGYFLLDRDARRRAMACRGARSQLGYAVQLGTVRFLGTFLANPEHVPPAVVAYVAEQLGLEPEAFSGYGTDRTRWDHQQAIKDAYRYRDLSGLAWWELARWRWDRAWSGNERPIALFDLATLYLVENKVLLPGATVLERLVSSLRQRTARRTWRVLAAAPAAAERVELEALLRVEGRRRTSKLDRLRRSPREVSGPGVGKALDRYLELDALGACGWNLTAIPVGRLHQLARYACTARAQAVAELTPDRRTATLVAFAATMRTTAADEAIEVFDLLMADLARQSSHRAVKTRLRTLGDLDAAALLLREAWITVTHAASEAGTDVREALDLLDLAAVHDAARTVRELARPQADTLAGELQARYLDRYGRSLHDLITMVGDLRTRSIGFTSLHEQLDTTTPGGRLVFHVFAALAEFIRELIVIGTHEGLAAARARGRTGGRPTVATPEVIRAARDLLPNPEYSITAIAKLLGVSPGTLYNHIPDLQELRTSTIPRQLASD